MTSDRMRIGLYALAAATAAAMLASVVLLKRPGVPVGAATLAALQPSLVLGIFALAARFPVRAMPLRRTGATRLIATHAVSAAAAAGVWLVA